MIIQSVLDVKDDNPLPKGATVANPFNRSILILTPKRALKFTATSIERHYVWLTALSFLSHSATGLQDLAALPPIPQAEFESPAPTASLRRNPIRDSIRIAKGRPRPNIRGKRNKAPAPVPELPANGSEIIDSMFDVADPPTVPRFSSHARKRSNTTSRMPVMRSFSSQGTMPSIPSIHSMATRGGSPVSHGHGLNSAAAVSADARPRRAGRPASGLVTSSMLLAPFAWRRSSIRRRLVDIALGHGRGTHASRRASGDQTASGSTGNLPCLRTASPIRSEDSNWAK